MQDIFWLIPGRIAGRAGPNRLPWTVGELQQAGFGAVLSVNDGELCHADEFARLGIEYACMPLSPNAPPLPGDLELCVKVLPRAYEFVCAQLAQQRRVLIHCSSGKDRTCLLMAYFLVRHEDIAPRAAISRVRALRPIAFSAKGWGDFARLVLRESVYHQEASVS